MASSINREANALSHVEVHEGARSIALGNNNTGLSQQRTEQANTLPEIVTGEPIAAPYADIILVGQGGKSPRHKSNPSSPEIQPEDAPSHSEHVLLLIKQGWHRIRFFSANIQGKWTDRDTFFQIKDHYDHHKSSWWYLNTLSHVEFKKVGSSKNLFSMISAELGKFYVYHSDHVDIADRKKRRGSYLPTKMQGGLW